MNVELQIKTPDSEEFREKIQGISKKSYLDFVEDLLEESDNDALTEDISMLKDLWDQFVKSVKADTLTLEEVESLLERVSRLPQLSKRDYLLEFLFREKAGFLLRQGKKEDALQNFEEALEVNPVSPFSWYMKGGSLATLGRLEEALQAFRRAYALRENFLNHLKKDMLGDLFFFWISVACGLVFLGASEHDARKLKVGIEEYLETIEKAKSEGFQQFSDLVPSLDDLELPEATIKNAFEQLYIATRLASIERSLSQEPSDPQLWFNKGLVLAQLEQYPQAVAAFEQAYEFRGALANWSTDLYRNWATIDLLCGVDALLNEDIKTFEHACLNYISLFEKAQMDGQDQVVEEAKTHFKGHLKSKRELAAFEELELAVNLMKIKDPFEGWRALSKEISKVWPKGVSAVKAVREMRR